MKIRLVLILTFLLTGIVLASLGTYVSNSQDIKFVEGEIINHLQTTAQSRANHIVTYLDQNVEKLNIIKSKTLLRGYIKDYNANPNENSRNQINSVLMEVKQSFGDSERISVIGLDGKVIASTNFNFIGRDFSEQKFFKDGLQKESVNFMAEDNQSRIFISGPIKLNGELIGVQLIVMDNEGLKKIVQERTGLGTTGEILIAVGEDGDRYYIVDRLFENEAISSEQELSATAEPMKQALLGEEMSFTNTLDYRNKEVIAVSKYITKYDLGLVAKIDRDETFGVVETRFWKTSTILVLAIIFATLIIGFFVSKLISKPIQKITEDVNNITSGNLDVQLEKSSIEEVNGLIDSLNRVLASMKLAILRTGASKQSLGLGEAIKKKEEAETKLQELLDNIYDIVYEYDNKGNLVFIGGNLSKYGYTRDDLQGQNLSNFVCLQDKEKVLSDVTRTLKTGQEFPTRFRMLTKDKGCVLVEEIGKVKRDEKGNILGVVGTVRDVGEESADINNSILVVLNRAGNVQVINEKGAEILGYKDESEIVGKNWFDNFVPVKMRAKVKDVSNKMISGKMPINKFYENPVITKSGKEINVAWHGEVIKNQNGEIIGHLAAGKVVAENKQVDEEKEINRSNAIKNVVKRLADGAREGLMPKKPVMKEANTINEKKIVEKSDLKKPVGKKFESNPVPVKKSVKQGDAFVKDKDSTKK